MLDARLSRDQINRLQTLDYRIATVAPMLNEMATAAAASYTGPSNGHKTGVTANGTAPHDDFGTRTAAPGVVRTLCRIIYYDAISMATQVPLLCRFVIIH